MAIGCLFLVGAFFIISPIAFNIPVTFEEYVSGIMAGLMIMGFAAACMPRKSREGQHHWTSRHYPRVIGHNGVWCGEYQNFEWVTVEVADRCYEEWSIEKAIAEGLEKKP